VEVVGAASDAEDVGVGAGGVLVVWSQRRPAPVEEVDFLGGVEGVGAEDVEEEGLREGDGRRIEVSSAGVGEGFGEGGHQE
jgi:hypothetical protein